jgi:hypothetical protein
MMVECGSEHPGKPGIFCMLPAEPKHDPHMSGYGPRGDQWPAARPEPPEMDGSGPPRAPTGRQPQREFIVGAARRARRADRARNPQRRQFGLSDPHVYLHGNAHDTEISAAETARRKSAEDRTNILRAIAVAAEGELLGLIDAEMQELFDMPGNTERPRRVELEDMGYIEDSGRRRFRRGTRNECIIWTITEAGLKALRDLPVTV